MCVGGFLFALGQAVPRYPLPWGGEVEATDSQAEAAEALTAFAGLWSQAGEDGRSWAATLTFKPRQDPDIMERCMDLQCRDRTLNHEHPKQVAPGRQYGRKRMGRFMDRLFELGADRVLFSEERGHQYTERLHYHAVVKAVGSLGSRELRSAWRYSWGQSQVSLVHSLAAVTGYVVKYVLKGVVGDGSPEPSYFDFVDRDEQVRRMGGVQKVFYAPAGAAGDAPRLAVRIRGRGREHNGDGGVDVGGWKALAEERVSGRSVAGRERKGVHGGGGE